jgi:uncharacterized protein YebE (UPF0316 family)
MEDMALWQVVGMTLAIFLARVVDVSLGTLRTILVFRGRRFIAAFIGFFEVLIWLMAAGQVISDLSAWYLAVSYAAGFATGNIVGIWLESRLALGLELVRVVSESREVSVANLLRESGFSAIELAGLGDRDMPVEIVFLVVRRRAVRNLLKRIEAIDPQAFCTISDIKQHQSLDLLSLSRTSKGFASVVKSK